MSTKGNHIKVYRNLYEHHGIDCGDGTVIHFSGEPSSKSDAQIVRITKMNFLNGGKEEIVQYSNSFSPDEVVKRAESKLFQKDYSLMLNNCESFAAWCKTGNNDSKQVNDVAEIADSLMADGNPIGGVLALVGTGFALFELINTLFNDDDDII